MIFDELVEKGLEKLNSRELEEAKSFFNKALENALTDGSKNKYKLFVAMLLEKKNDKEKNENKVTPKRKRYYYGRIYNN